MRGGLEFGKRRGGCFVGCQGRAAGAPEAAAPGLGLRAGAGARPAAHPPPERTGSFSPGIGLRSHRRAMKRNKRNGIWKHQVLYIYVYMYLYFSPNCLKIIKQRQRGK